MHTWRARIARAPFYPTSAVTKRIPQPRAELSPVVREHEAKLLATMLRSSRLTWVFAEPGADKSALLKNGVMPLLQRRRGDRADSDEAAPGGASPVPPRERRRARQRPRREVAIYFDAWDDAPLTRLKRRIQAIAPMAGDTGGDDSFAALLQRVAQQQPAHFVFVLDRFEDCLALASRDAELGRFAEELVEALARDASPASFLVAMDEAARPALERFRSRLPGFDHDVLRLAPVARRPDPAGVPTLVDVHQEALSAARPHGPPPRVPIRVEDVYALIEAKLTRNQALPHPEDAAGELPGAAYRRDRA